MLNFHISIFQETSELNYLQTKRRNHIPNQNDNKGPNAKAMAQEHKISPLVRDRKCI